MIDQERLHKMYSKVIYKVLHDAKIPMNTDFFEESYQELYIKLIWLAQLFKGDPLAESERYRFVAFAKKSLSNHLKDLLRKNRTRYQVCPDDCLKHYVGSVMDNELAETFMLADVRKKLSESDMRFLEVALMDLSVVEQARILGISRKQYYTRRKQIAQKYLR